MRELAERDPAEAAAKLFDFAVLDPACGSAHFLVEVVEELADQIAELLGELALPRCARSWRALRARAGTRSASGVEDAALLKRLVLKRCVYGVDLSPMGAEIAKVSLWLATFVPGLSLAYLDHNVQVGNSLIGVARPEQVAPPGAEAARSCCSANSSTRPSPDAAREAASCARSRTARPTRSRPAARPTASCARRSRARDASSTCGRPSRSGWPARARRH